MAKSKKPRKAYKPHKVKNPGVFYPRELIDQCKDIVNDITLVAELTLPRGVATDDHMYQIQDLLNWGGVLLYNRRKQFDSSDYKEFMAEHYCALHAFSRIVQRKRSGKSAGYVGTAEELKYIRDVCAEICGVLKEGLEVSPQKTLREFLASLELAKNTRDDNRELGKPLGVIELQDLPLQKLMRKTFFDIGEINA